MLLKARSGWLNILLAVVVAGLTAVFAEQCYAGYDVFGYRYASGAWQTYPDGGKTYYHVDHGMLFDGSPDDVNYYSAGTNCGTADHKPGDADWMGHWHVNRSDWPTHGTVTYPEITESECEKYYEVKIKYEGVYDGKYHLGGGLTDCGATQDVASTDADFHFNCHGYAFEQDGLSRFKFLITDGSTGAGRVLSDTAGFYEEFTAGSESMAGDIMYMETHTNYVVSDVGASSYNADSIRFKSRSSQIFNFTYASPGRSSYQKFFGSLSPSYYQRK